MGPTFPRGHSGFWVCGTCCEFNALTAFQELVIRFTKEQSQVFCTIQITILNMMIHASIHPIADSHRYSHYATIWKCDPEIVLGFFPAICFAWSFVSESGPLMMSWKYLESSLRS